MKKLFMLSALAATTFLARAQNNKAAEAIYDELEEQSGIFIMSFSKSMLDDIDADIEWNDQVKNLEGEISKIKLMLLGEDAKPSATLSKVKARLSKMGYKSTKLSDAESDDKVWVYTNRKGNHFTEAHFVIFGDDGGGFFVSVYGDFTLTKEKD